MDDRGYINPKFSGNVSPETEAPKLEDLSKASQLVDESVLRILAEEGRYVGAVHPQDNMEAFSTGHGQLMTYALFEADMDGVKALAPLTHQQLLSLMEMTAKLNHPQGKGFAEQVKQAAFALDATKFVAKPAELHAA